MAINNNKTNDLKGKISKQANKVAVVENLEKQKNYEIDLLKQEIQDHKNKIDEMNTIILKKNQEISNLENKLEEKTKECSTNGILKFIFLYFIKVSI